MMKLPYEIQRKLDKLNALENGGVDNWEWHDEALTEWYKEGQKKELADAFLDEILETLCEGIEEPAGRGCGYGFRPDVQAAALQIVLNKVKEYNE